MIKHLLRIGLRRQQKALLFTNSNSFAKDVRKDAKKEEVPVVIEEEPVDSIIMKWLNPTH